MWSVFAIIVIVSKCTSAQGMTVLSEFESNTAAINAAFLEILFFPSEMPVFFAGEKNENIIFFRLLRFCIRVDLLEVHRNMLP